MSEAAKMLKVLVTGAGGQLGQELVKLDVLGLEFVGVDRQAMDITDSEQCAEVISRIAPDVIIHCAAYTAVDLIETEEVKAWQVNAEGTRNVAEAAEVVGAKLCYVSTDYVFDGGGTQPYREDDKTNPQTVYGRTKLAGEIFAREACSKTFIVRTSWVYGRYGTNFVYTMLRLAQQHDELKVVNDQIGSPTYTLDLARFIADIIQTKHYGIYHASNTGSCTWYDFAQAIFEEAGFSDKLMVIPCKTEEFSRPAPRPSYSVLGHEALIQAGLKPLRHWREALNEFLKHL
ncbi:dTDP-4-dehydrorhamnose reductase [Cohnella sp.]|uniref:dTDP-4-dehydrorhamnose reductase n=1 Tax=Cohnella sp. TaxID=1883426 RepID=UPI00356A62B7